MKFLIKFFLPFLMIGIMSPAFSATLKWSMPGDSLTLDPHAQNEGPTHMVSRQVYESLVTRTVDMSIQPQLATSWTTTDPETWVFQIRDGVVFSDGSPLKASDVVFSINRALSGASDVKELIEEYAGGMLDGHEFYAYFPGGASGGILPAHMSDIPLDFDTLNEYDCFIGSAAIIIPVSYTHLTLPTKRIV